jgi:hypothetical protein
MSDPVVGEWRIDDKRGEGMAHLVSSVHLAAAPSRRFQPAMGEYTFKCGARSTGGFIYSVPARSGDEHCTVCVGDAA